MAQERDPRMGNQDRRDVRDAGTRNAAAQNPRQRKRTNQPNAGGQNREAGDRKARQNDRATNGGE